MTELSSREVILARIITALGGSTRSTSPLTIPRDYHQVGSETPSTAELLDQLVDRLEDYRATVHRCGPGQIAATVATALAARGARRVVVPPGLEPAWTAAWQAGSGGELTRDAVDSPLAVAALDRMDGVLTGCTVAIAQTGTLVLDAAPDQGRRVITLVPDYHLVVVFAHQVVATVPDGLAQLDPSRPLTMISGPSATSDIELSRVEGVHGPRTLEVILVA